MKHDSSRAMIRRLLVWAVLALLVTACGAAGPTSPGDSSSPISGGSGTATLSWDAPSMRTDGSPLTDLAGYRVYLSLDGGPYLAPIDVGLVTEHTISGLASGAYRFAVTAYDTAGGESDLSLPVTKTIP